MENTKRIALITGGSKGIGYAIAENLQDKFDVVTVSRKGPTTEQGDLIDKSFRNYLISKYTPYIFVNNAAGLYQDSKKMLEVNGTVPVDLLLSFYEKMNTGIIINVSSQSAEKILRPKEDLSFNVYAVAKKFLKDTSVSLNYSKNKPIKVMCVSPAVTHTSLLKHITDFQPNINDYENFNWKTSVAWTKPDEVAKIIRFLIDLPPHMNIPEIVLDNHYSQAIYL